MYFTHRSTVTTNLPSSIMNGGTIDTIELGMWITLLQKNLHFSFVPCSSITMKGVLDFPTWATVWVRQMVHRNNIRKLYINLKSTLSTTILEADVSICGWHQVSGHTDNIRWKIYHRTNRIGKANIVFYKMKNVLWNKSLHYMKN